MEKKHGNGNILNHLTTIKQKRGVTISMKTHTTKRSARMAPKKVQLKKGAKGLTAQAGLIPAVKFLQSCQLESAIKTTLKHTRGANALYDAVDAVFLGIIGILGGARAMSGIITVWADTFLCRLAGWCRIPDETTLGRLFRTFEQRHIDGLETLTHVLRGRVWRKALRTGKSMIAAKPCFVIDVDSTVKTAYGCQEGVVKGYNPHKRGGKSYHPLLAFCADTKEILQGWLRCGNAYTSNGVVEFTRQLLAHLPNKTRILFRGDSGFFVGSLLDELDGRGHGYLIKVKLKNLIGLLQSQQWESVPGQAGWEQCVFWYQCMAWDVSRRFVAVRQEQEDDGKKTPGLFELKQYNWFCYVVSEDLDPWHTHKTYGKRATCETWIEEAKNQMALANIKTNDFWANSALFQCAILAYNTVRWMALCSGDKLLQRWEPATVRSFLIRVAAKFTNGGRQQKVTVPDRLLYERQWDAWVEVGFAT